MSRPQSSIRLSNDEIEVACDLLWALKREAGLSPIADELWQRLQPIRRGDYGGTAFSDLSPQEAHAVVEASEVIQPCTPLDEDEAGLVTRLRSLLV